MCMDEFSLGVLTQGIKNGFKRDHGEDSLLPSEQEKHDSFIPWPTIS